jgi:hypothetical protein
VEFFASMENVDLSNILTIEFFDGILDINLGSRIIYHSGIHSLEFSISTLVSNDESFDDGIEGIHRKKELDFRAEILDTRGMPYF